MHRYCRGNVGEGECEGGWVVDWDQAGLWLDEAVGVIPCSTVLIMIAILLWIHANRPD